MQWQYYDDTHIFFSVLSAETNPTLSAPPVDPQQDFNGSAC